MKALQIILTVIGAYVLYLLIRFVIDLIIQRRKVKHEGGMRIKYAEIIRWVMSEYPGARIFQENTTFLSVGARAMSGTTAFWLTQTFGNVTIQYKFSSGMGGNVNLEWTFPEQMEQTEMIAQMNQDIIRKHTKM